MRVAVVSPTTSQFVEKMAVLFPEGITVVGPLADTPHYWNDYRRRAAEWRSLALRIELDLRPYREIDFSQYDLAIHTIESFDGARDWALHCERVECPILIKACWTRDPENVAPTSYIEAMKDFPVLLEMPAHIPLWKAAGFRDVNLVYNPVGDWWFAGSWTGEDPRALLVLSGRQAWRGEPGWFGLDLWERLERRFPGRMHLHDGHEHYRTPAAMAALFRQSRVFVNLDIPYGQGERPLTLAFTEALCAGMPVAARDLPGLSYARFIDGNGVCSDDFETLATFLDRCLQDHGFAHTCSTRSRQLGREHFGRDRLRPQYDAIIARAHQAFRQRQERFQIRTWGGAERPAPPADPGDAPEAREGPTPVESPALSVVATSRNDDHGGDLLFRMQHFVDGLAAQAARHAYPLELLIVEWNPPRTHPPLAEALVWPAPSRWFTIRILSVPPDVHDALDHSEALPLFQMIAKNVGIRRARAPFVLATNIDILFPDALMAYLKAGLQKGVLYRTDRLDVRRDLPAARTFAAVLDHCGAHIIRRHRAKGTFIPQKGRWVNQTGLPGGVVGWLIRQARHDLKTDLRAYVAAREGAGDRAGRRRLRARLRRAWRRGMLGMGWLGFHLRRPRETRERWRQWIRRSKQYLRTSTKFISLHTNGCGDFTLLDRESWADLRGYAEWPIFSWNLDSIFLFRADANGYPVVHLPPSCAIYHIDHGAGWTPEEHAKLFQGLVDRRIPFITEQDFFAHVSRMRKNSRKNLPTTYNGPDWGYASHAIPEHRVLAPAVTAVSARPR